MLARRECESQASSNRRRMPAYSIHHMQWRTRFLAIVVSPLWCIAFDARHAYRSRHLHWSDWSYCLWIFHLKSNNKAKCNMLQVLMVDGLMDAHSIAINLLQAFFTMILLATALAAWAGEVHQPISNAVIIASDGGRMSIYPKMSRNVLCWNCHKDFVTWKFLQWTMKTNFKLTINTHFT